MMAVYNKIIKFWIGQTSKMKIRYNKNIILKILKTIMENAHQKPINNII